MGYKLLIKGIEFECFIYSEKEYEEKFPEDKSKAFTDGTEAKIHFMEPHFSEALCRHELSHAYSAACFLDDIDLTAEQVEELHACINEFHGPERDQKASELYENLKV